MMQLSIPRPTWADINLDNVAHNIREVRRCVGDNVAISAVIKADGYGHGALHIAQTLLDNGANQFSVATLSEARLLRKSFPDVPILILGYTPVSQIEEVIHHQLTQCVFDEALILQYATVAEAVKKPLRLHVKIETGMNRLGFLPKEETIHVLKKAMSQGPIDIEGVFTHFACADEADQTHTRLQGETFKGFLALLKEHGVSIKMVHACNSAGIMAYPEYHFNMVRPGIMLYGLYPSQHMKAYPIFLKEVVSLKTRVAQVKRLIKGDGVGYGQTFVAQGDMQSATLPIGYADGYVRGLSGKGMGIIAGIKRPIIGRVCMDQCMLDVTGLMIDAGEEVVLIGKQGAEKITVDDVAAWMGTINYEVVCLISKRVPRCYYRNGTLVEVADFLLL